MAWNRPTEREQGIGNREQGKSPFRGFVVAAVVIVGAVAAWWMWPDASAPVAEDGDGTAGRRIKEAIPAPTPTNAAPVVAAEKPKPKHKTYIDEHGVERYEGGLRVVKKWPKPPADQMNTNKHLFKHSAELQIQWLLEMEPGEFRLDIPFDARFDKSLTKSFADKIEFLPEDTPEERQTKEDVIAAKKELKAAMALGRNAYEVMNETREELMRLYRYRDNLEQEIKTKRDSGEMSEADIKDYISAANTLLERNGIKPLKMNSVSTKILLQKMRGKNK